ncbi:MAG TPA: hypothetical protein VFG00_02195 [Acidothermaceae bacterium]|nr:hypothetical protein [Acidothermaceae bacterium]
MPVGFHCDGPGVRDGSSSDHVSVGSGDDESGVGLTVGMAAGVPPGEVPRLGSWLSSLFGVALGARGEELGVTGPSVASLTSSGSSSTWTGWVGYTNVNAGFFDGAAASELAPVGAAPPTSAAAGIDTSTRVPLA